MLPERHQPTFIQAVIAELGNFPQSGLFYIGGWALVSVSVDLFSWSHRPGYQISDYILAGSTLIGGAAITFFSATRMVETPMTWRRALKFFGTGAALFAPLLLASSVTLLALKLKVQWGVFAGLFLLIPSLLPLAFLPGWPIWQATSERLIGPIEAFRATKGFRWPLIGAACFGSGFNQAIPRTSSANDLLTACILSVSSSLLACMSTVLGLSIAVAAYRKMSAAHAQA